MLLLEKRWGQMHNSDSGKGFFYVRMEISVADKRTAQVDP